MVVLVLLLVVEVVRQQVLLGGLGAQLERFHVFRRVGVACPAVGRVRLPDGAQLLHFVFQQLVLLVYVVAFHLQLLDSLYGGRNIRDRYSTTVY